MNRITLIIITLGLALASCSGSKPAVTPSYPDPIYADMVLEVGEPLTLKTEGLGAQFDMCIIEPSNHTDTDWELITQAVEESNLQAVRIRFYPEIYERQNDNDNPDLWNQAGADFTNADMQCLYKLLDLFEKNHINVDLSWYGCRTTFASTDGKVKGSWLGGTYGEGGIKSWMVAPSDKYVANSAEEYAESVAECLDYLINAKGYTCLYEYSIFPEPEGVINDLTTYGKIADSIKKRLQNKGLADRIKFSGPADYGNDANNLKNKYLSKEYPYDKVTSSVYKFHGTTGLNNTTQQPSTNKVMYEFGAAHVAAAAEKGLSWGVAECGTSNFLTAITNADTDTFDRALTMFRFFVNLTNSGCTNIKYFVFSDAMYDGNINRLGLFRHKSKYYNDSMKDYQARPVWYAWSLLMRYSDIGSTIYPLTTTQSDICATALKLPDGSWTYALANITAKDIPIVIINSAEPENMKVYNAPAASKKTLEIVKPKSDAGSGERIRIIVPANSYVVLSNKE